MDGENNGKPYEQMDDLGIPLFLETPIMMILFFNQEGLHGFGRPRATYLGLGYFKYLKTMNLELPSSDFSLWQIMKLLIPFLYYPKFAPSLPCGLFFFFEGGKAVERFASDKRKSVCPHQDPTFKLFGNPWGRLF